MEDPASKELRLCGCSVRFTICALVASLVACELDNPCPRGTTRGRGRCVASESSDGEMVEPGDSSAPPEDVTDADMPDRAMDSGETEPLEVGGGGDAEALETRDADGDSDADADGEAGIMPAECTGEERDGWRRFQMSEDAVPAILTCSQGNPMCGTGACDISGCLKSAAQVDGCDRCVGAEVACATENCTVACSLLTDDDACRACACANGCLDAPVGCGVGSRDACADCAGASCSARFASTTDTITIPIFFHLLHDRVEPATGLPAYGIGAGEPETILDVDEQLAQINANLEAARPDARRLRVLRAGVNYIPAPAPDVCPDPVVWTDARRLFGGLNVVLTGEKASCPALSSSAFAGRASGASLLRTLGNLLGVAPMDQAGEPWQITREQFVRMHDYTRWRLGAADAVPDTERQTSSGFMHGPADPIWDKLTNRDWALTNASVFESTAAGPFTSLPVTETFVVGATGAARRVLGVRVGAKFLGVPSENLQIVVNSQRHTTTPIPRSAIWVGNGMLVAEEAFDSAASGSLDRLRLRYPAGQWRVSIDDTAALTLSDIRLEIIMGDRTFASYDRHARGVADVMVYRPSSSELLTAANPGNKTTTFGVPVSDLLQPLPDSQAKVISGDVDGDGQVDLLARRGPTIWVAFDKRGFAAWRPGSIAGTDRPAESDDVLMGDFDGDGFGDLLRRRSDLAHDQSLWAYYRGFGDGTFEAGRTFEIPGKPYRVGIKWTVADLSRAGRSDLVARESPARIVVNYNDTPGPPTTSGTMPSLYGGWWPSIGGVQAAFEDMDRLVVFDANQDGSDDLVARRTGSGEWFVCLNQGEDTFFTPMERLTIGHNTMTFNDTDTVLGSAP